MGSSINSLGWSEIVSGGEEKSEWLWAWVSWKRNGKILPLNYYLNSGHFCKLLFNPYREDHVENKKRRLKSIYFKKRSLNSHKIEGLDF